VTAHTEAIEDALGITLFEPEMVSSALLPDVKIWLVTSPADRDLRRRFLKAI